MIEKEQQRKEIIEFVNSASNLEIWSLHQKISRVIEGNKKLERQRSCSHPSFSYSCCGSHKTYYECDVCGYIKGE